MIKDRRKSNRIPLQISADYLEENKQEWQNCFLVDVTYDGIGILLYMREAIQLGSKMRFTINLASKNLQATGTVTWSKKLRRDTSFNCALGVKLSMMDDISKSNLLNYACSNFYKSDKQ